MTYAQNLLTEGNRDRKLTKQRNENENPAREIRQ